MPKKSSGSPSRKFNIVFLIFATVLAAIILYLFHTDGKLNRSNIEFINSYNWQVDEKPVSISYVSVPESFDPIFSAYCEIITEDGFDFYAYRGKRVTRYSYKVINHNTSADGLIRVNIFVYKNKIVAADISNISSDGFVLPIGDTSGLSE